MLSLAHGAKGLIFSDYDSYPVNESTEIDSAIVGGPPDFIRQDLWYVIHDNLVPRLLGKLGNRLLGLRYTGHYIQLRSDINAIPPNTYDYLTLGYNQQNTNLNWHAGFLELSESSDDKYFFLANLITTSNEDIQISVTPPVSGYTNFRFRNYEGYFDTTFTGTQFTYMLTHPAGEGYLYEVAPVVKYGGFLVADDTINQDFALLEKMVIRNGAEITINDDNIYTISNTTILEGTGFITGDGYISLLGNGIIVTNRWDKSLFKGRADNHPKLIWSKYPSDTITVSSYKVYGKYGSAA